ncbi:hypothetical protein LCGC14_0620040 [marine sediment metagenome]|uniref:Uncharacterized protein n=1 Tax=marine sediment metagenome TaxID=412755 RepID=A0A0F9RPE3_9ZZZZ
MVCDICRHRFTCEGAKERIQDREKLLATGEPPCNDKEE